MANPELAIAKATFSASLFRKDPVVAAPCTRDEADQFHHLLQDAVRQCSPLNVQNCKRWILKHVVSSPGRAVALAKYLVAVANSFTEDGWQEGGETAERDTTRRKSSGKPTARRKRLHVAYVLHDVLYHAKKHGGESRGDGFAAAVRDSLVPLFSSVAAFDAPRHVGKVKGLLDIWDKEGLCVPNQISSLRAAVEAASTGGANYLGTSTALIAGSSSPAKTKEVPFMIPVMHGDPSTPWFDLPAANWLPHMRPNSTKPISPNMIKPLQLAPGLADTGLIDAVKRLLSNVDRLFARDGGADGDGPYTDVNEMGERVILDELTGDITGGQTYYGWSRDFCKKMSRRQKGGDSNNERRGRSMSRSSGRSSGRSDSRESSSPAHKRRRLSRSQSRGRRYSSGSRRSASRRSRSKSRSLSRLRDRSRSRNRSYSRDRYRRRSSSPRRASRSRSQSKSRDRDYRRRYSPSPPPPDRDGTGYAEHPQPPHFQQHIPPPHLPHQPFYPNQGSPPPPMPVPHPNFMAFPQDSVIPPPPPNYSGPWPPPPPPIPPPIGNPHVQNMGMPWGPAPVLPGGHAPLPPPPPLPPNPTPSHPQQFGRGWARPPNSQYGRGNNSFRGGYGGRGRGRSW